MFALLKPSDVTQQWPLLEAFIQRCDRGRNNEYTLEDLKKEALEGKRDFWVVFCLDGGFKIEAVVTTYIFQTPQKKIWFCHLVWGEDHGKWSEEIMHTFVREAVLSGCDALQMNARRGVGKALRNYGWKELSIVFEREITDGDRNGRLKPEHESVGNIVGDLAREPVAEYQPEYQ